MLAALVALVGLEAWWWRDTDRAARRALSRLKEGNAERERLAREAPAPTAEYEAAVRGRIDAVHGAIAELRGKFAGAETITPDPAPAKPVDAYFEVAAFVEQMRASAVQARVAVRPDERFGFAALALEGPPPDLVAAVERQRVGTQRLLEFLLRSQPQALLAVQREPPLTAPERAQRNHRPRPGAEPSPAAQARSDGLAAADYFAFDRNLSLRIAGVVDSDAFRLEFTGRTSSLRMFLNRLAASPCPVAVRSIEVAPLPPGIRESSPPGGGSTAPVPVVSPHLSRFTVIVEMLRLPRPDGPS